jgi:hypothetical protein
VHSSPLISSSSPIDLQALQHRQLIQKATEDNEAPTAGYIYNEITSECHNLSCP